MYLFSSTAPPSSIPKISAVIPEYVTHPGRHRLRSPSLTLGGPRNQQPALDRPSVGQEPLCSWQVDADHSNIVIAQFLGSSQFIDPHLERRGISRVKRVQKRPRILALFIFL